MLNCALPESLSVCTQKVNSELSAWCPIYDNVVGVKPGLRRKSLEFSERHFALSEKPGVFCREILLRRPRLVS